MPPRRRSRSGPRPTPSQRFAGNRSCRWFGHAGRTAVRRTRHHHAQRDATGRGRWGRPSSPSCPTAVCRFHLGQFIRRAGLSAIPSHASPQTGSPRGRCWRRAVAVSRRRMPRLGSAPGGSPRTALRDLLHPLLPQSYETRSARRACSSRASPAGGSSSLEGLITQPPHDEPCSATASPRARFLMERATYPSPSASSGPSRFLGTRTHSTRYWTPLTETFSTHESARSEAEVATGESAGPSQSPPPSLVHPANRTAANVMTATIGFIRMTISTSGSWVEVRGFEPLTSAVRRQRSTGLSYTPQEGQGSKGVCRAGRLRRRVRGAVRARRGRARCPAAWPRSRGRRGSSRSANVRRRSSGAGSA